MTDAYGLPAGNPGGGRGRPATPGGTPAFGGSTPASGGPSSFGGGAPAFGGPRATAARGGVPVAAGVPMGGGASATGGASAAGSRVSGGASAAGGSRVPGSSGRASVPGGAVASGGAPASGGTGAAGSPGSAGGTGAAGPGPAGGVPAAGPAGAGGAGADDAAVARRVRVVLVDDHRMFRTGVQAEIGDTDRTGVEVVGEAADVDQAVTVITATRPEVVLLDVHLPGGGGVEVLRRSASMMADQERPVRFLALSVSDAAEDVIGVIRGGARGYVTKTITGTDLVDAIFRVSEGDAVFSPRLAGFVLDAFASTDAPPVDEDLDRLTQREREVLRLIARGYAYKEIAKQLFISVKTVESHVSAVLRKLQLSNRHELTRWATARRLV